MSIYGKLMLVQSALKAPKNKKNSYGNYNYRSAEAILESVKPLLSEQGLTIVLSDEIVNIGNRFYVKANVSLVEIDSGEKISNSALAREDEVKKGMDSAQITGTASSYARKYALNGIFAIDDTKDHDTDEYIEEAKKKAEEAEEETNKAKSSNKSGGKKEKQISDIEAAKKGIRVLVDNIGMKVLNRNGAYTYLTDYDIESLNKILHTAGYEAAYDTIRDLMVAKTSK